MSPGKSPRWNLCEYSTYLIPMNTNAQMIVIERLAMRPVFWPSCALRTAHAAVRLEKMSTPVLMAPQVVSSAFDAKVKTSGCIAR